MGEVMERMNDLRVVLHQLKFINDSLEKALDVDAGGVGSGVDLMGDLLERAIQLSDYLAESWDSRLELDRLSS